MANAHPAPSHLDVVDADSASSAITHEQTPFVMKERGELLPLQRKRLSDPSKWIKNQRKFDTTWGNTTFEYTDGTLKHMLPSCHVEACLLDCNKITREDVELARSLCEPVANRGINEQK